MWWIPLILVILWAWLKGYWFARVVAFIALIPGFFIYDSRALDWMIDLGANSDRTPLWALPVAIAAFGMAWLVASLPIYYHNWKRKRLSRPAYRLYLPERSAR